MTIRHKIALRAASLSLCLPLMTSCALTEQNATTETSQEEGASGVTISVVTTFAGEDGNAVNYRNAVIEWQSQTGNSVRDNSAVSDETLKTRVITDFETGSEPDVLFFFNGADADDFIRAGRVVSIEEIRETYPEYASNMDDDKIPASTADGVQYAIPVNGYWEALYVNKAVLERAGVSIPDENTTWEEFLVMCRKIKDAGMIPIAAAMGNIPHYWWEYAIFNEHVISEHLIVPRSAQDRIGRQWVSGLSELKELYELGYFPDNTLSASDNDTFKMFLDGRAAFLLDGSWKVGAIERACRRQEYVPLSLNVDKLANYTVTYVPGNDKRKTNELIGGLSMGYYITRKAYDDPEKRDAAVSFVEYMTSNEVVMQFAQHTANALKDAPDALDTYSNLQKDAMKMVNEAESLTPALQDTFNGTCREPTFDGMPDLLTGNTDITEEVQKSLVLYYKELDKKIGGN